MSDDLKVLALAQKVSEHLGFVLTTLIRGTITWAGLCLVDLPSFGLPAIGWVQAVGIVLALRPVFTQVVKIRSEQPASPAMQQGATQLLNSIQASMAASTGSPPTSSR